MTKLCNQICLGIQSKDRKLITDKKTFARTFYSKEPRSSFFYVEYRELSHLTRDLSQAKKKINVVTS